LELIWDLEFVIWDFGGYAPCALHFANLHWEAEDKNASDQESKPNKEGIRGP
jgi:hypothetical protein